MLIAIEECNNQTYKGSCESVEEISKFVSENVFYYAGQTTTVSKDIFSYSSDNINTRYSVPAGSKDPADYFPL